MAWLQLGLAWTDFPFDLRFGWLVGWLVGWLACLAASLLAFPLILRSTGLTVVASFVQPVETSVSLFGSEERGIN